jgi:D-3-phosphoglycerate dehydrogenase
MRILLLEGIHPVSVQQFEEAGYRVETRKDACTEDELAELISNVHILGIRSKTQLSCQLLEQANNLLAVGCFCIGTNQVDLDSARRQGVAVFNAPFSNTRSVAELTMANVVMLARKAAQRSLELHSGRWVKSSDNCHEVRNKTLGIVGYGHIGPQVGLLAEAFGMRVVFYDILKKLPLGNASPLGTLKELLQKSDFVTLHVPETDQTKGMIGDKELSCMRRGSYLLNLSRGSVVDLEALKSSMEAGQIAGAALDVYPTEPVTKEAEFEQALRGVPNVILTPHIGGSTQEAQENIGLEVSDSLLKFIERGSTTGAVNFPNVELPLIGPDDHRVLNIHRNIPGVLSEINSIIAEVGVNILAQHLRTVEDTGYLIMDVGPGISREIKSKIDQLEANVRTRLLF